VLLRAVYHSIMGCTPTQAHRKANWARLVRVRAPGGRWLRLSQSAILILGSPRSGTTWLAKIFDSHPDILYRHEPDELTLPEPDLDPAEQVRRWLRQRGLRAAAKRPDFSKSWRPAPLDHVRRGMAAALALAQRLPISSRAAKRIGIPDLVAPNRWGSVRAALKLVNWDGSRVARTMPDARCILVLRHPCGQVASLLAGLAASKFVPDSTPLDMATASAWAERAGVDADRFRGLPTAAKYAWRWRAFNEPAVEALRDLPNARVVIYEDLCSRPEATARDLFAFAGVQWHAQSTEFLDTSTRHEGREGYYDVFRSTEIVADRWRQTMSLADQEAVRTVLSTSELGRCWSAMVHSEV
jgi:Sulfotransferase family